MFKVVGTDTYLKEISRWSKSEIESAQKIPLQLAGNPFVGKLLSYPFLREKRIKEKRVYYLVYNDLMLILLVATSAKKDQQKTIDSIKENLKDYRIVAEDIAKRVS